MIPTNTAVAFKTKKVSCDGSANRDRATLSITPNLFYSLCQYTHSAHASKKRNTLTHRKNKAPGQNHQRNVRDDRPRVFSMREVAHGPSFGRIYSCSWMSIFAMTHLHTTTVHAVHVHIVVHRVMIAIGNSIGQGCEEESCRERSRSCCSPHRRDVTRGNRKLYFLKSRSNGIM